MAGSGISDRSPADITTIGVEKVIMIKDIKKSDRSKNHTDPIEQEKKKPLWVLLFLLIGTAAFWRIPEVANKNVSAEWIKAPFSPEIMIPTIQAEEDILHTHLIYGQTEEGAQLPAEIENPGSYQTMDYGSVLSESIHLEWPENGLVRKGLAIRLDHNSSMIFDTDLAGFVAGVADGWLDISKTDYTSYKGSEIASLEGRQVFGSSELAGWAKDGSFNGSRIDGMGKLPDDWAHYKGYYKYKDQVVLSYRIGEIDVLEIPETIKHDQSLAFIRTIQIDGSDDPMQALITEQHEDWSVSRVRDHEILFEAGAGDTTFAVGLTYAPDDAQLVLNEGRIELHISPSKTSRTLQVVMAEMNSTDSDLFKEIRDKFAQSDLPDFSAMTRGGSAVWNEEITMTGILSADKSGYVVDHIPIPFDNPWGSWMRLSGLDFFEDGTRAAVSTWNGDVWIVSGIDESLENMTWRRFASGLFYPMGVAIVDEQIFVTERSQLTRLHDLNGNGEADFYENFNNDGIVYPMAHTLGLEVDSKGYFYFFKNGNRVPSEVPQHGGLMRISPDGMTRELFSNGSRGSNTLGIGPDDMILSADQQGSWVPVERIDVMKQDGFYGFRPHGGEGLEVGEFEPPVAWIPYHVNNSSGSITYADDPRWGPLSEHWLLGSYGQSTLLLVLTQKLGEDKFQGGVVKLPIKSQSGLMRGRMNPGDGQLYMVGLRGWTTLGTEDGGFERVRYAGGKVYLPRRLSMSAKGIEIEFTEPLNRSSAGELQNYSLERWEYIYSERYGSPEVSLENPEVEDRDSVVVQAVTLSEDGRTVFLEIPDMHSVMQMKVEYDLMFEDEHPASNAIYSTVNWLSEAEASEKPEWQQRIIARYQETDIVDNTAIAEEKEDVSKDTEVPEWFRRGKEFFKNHCSECHINGVAPSMGTSEWAGTASPEAIIRILLNGKRGDKGTMTPFSWMDDEEIASIVSYIRMNWHRKSEPIHPSQIERIRNTTEGRTDLWTDEELKVILD